MGQARKIESREAAAATPPGAGAPDEALTLAATCARVLEAKKGRDIRVLHVGEVLPLTDYFVIVTGNNRRHTLAMAETLRRGLKQATRERPELGMSLLGKEGMQDGRWVLLDYGDVVVHMFQSAEREYYDLENLWSDAVPVDWESVAPLSVDTAILGDDAPYSDAPHSAAPYSAAPHSGEASV